MDDVTVNSNVENLELYSDSYPFRLSLRISNFENESEYKKYVRNCEMMIRRSVEYKLWRNYIVDVLQVNECAITHESMEDVTIEVHHHVPSLFTLVCGLINKRIDKNDEFCTFDICQEAIEIHFKNKIGYVALLKSMHEKFHNGKLTIPISFVKGDYKYFIREFSKYLDDDELEKIDLRMATNESNCTWSKDDYPVAIEGGR